jgi:hypothetical protein
VRIVGWLESLSEARVESTIIDRATNLKEQVGAASRPSHLLTFVHTAIHQEIGRSFGDRGSNSPESSETGSPTAAPHPEEMKGTVEFKLGNLATITATGRTTPAGLTCAALLVAAVLFPLAMMVRRRR